MTKVVRALCFFAKLANPIMVTVENDYYIGGYYGVQQRILYGNYSEDQE